MAPMRACRGAPRQLRVGVECNHIANLTERFQTSRLDGESIELSGQQLIQVKKLAALPLPAHPNALAHVKHAVTMEKDELAVAAPNRTLHSVHR
jgi:hypothetical protein